jgi:hypothetical protein
VSTRPFCVEDCNYSAVINHTLSAVKLIPPGNGTRHRLVRPAMDLPDGWISRESKVRRCPAAQEPSARADVFRPPPTVAWEAVLLQHGDERDAVGGSNGSRDRRGRAWGGPRIAHPLQTQRVAQTVKVSAPCSTVRSCKRHGAAPASAPLPQLTQLAHRAHHHQQGGCDGRAGQDSGGHRRAPVHIRGRCNVALRLQQCPARG